MSSRVKLLLRSFSSSLAACFGVEGLLGPLDEGQDVAHARGSGRRAGPGWKTSRASVFSPVPRNLTGTPVTARDRQRRAAAGVAVDLGQDQAGHRDGGDERLGDGDGLLAGHRVDDEQRLDRLDRRVDRGDLGHQRLVDRSGGRRCRG